MMVHVVKKMFEASTYVYSHDYLFSRFLKILKKFWQFRKIEKKPVNLEKLENF